MDRGRADRGRADRAGRGRAGAARRGAVRRAAGRAELRRVRGPHAGSARGARGGDHGYGQRRAGYRLSDRRHRSGPGRWRRILPIDLALCKYLDRSAGASRSLFGG
ncbi:hypothetical protein DLJ57_06645 [Micromonospora chalcea]|nr:hypothetical protein DLJ57_06645 [Micromonospora chalcea]